MDEPGVTISLNNYRASLLEGDSPVQRRIWSTRCAEWREGLGRQRAGQQARALNPLVGIQVYSQKSLGNCASERDLSSDLTSESKQ